MAILGNQIRSVPFIVDVHDGNASTTTFSLSRYPASTASIAVFINGLYQQPTANYTISGVDIVFTSAPPTGTENVLILHVGEGQVATQTPVNGSVDSTKMAANVSVTQFTANTILKVPVYTDNTARDSSITSPSNGMILISGSQFQGYNGGWVVLNN
jgi:hypothetical protein